MASHRNNVPLASGQSEFFTTHWSMVLQAGQREDQAADAALAALCQRYWYPLYAYVRRHVPDLHQAQDLTQEFFAWLLEKETLAAASPDRGRFRAFLLTTLKNFLSNQRDWANAKKRGGGVRPLRFDLDAGESRLSLEPADELTPERLFERKWIQTLLDLVMGRLEAEYRASGRAAQFDRLKGALTGDAERLPYATLGAELGLSEEAARQAASRLRRRYRELLRAEVLQTLDNPSDIDDEIRSLFAALSR